MIFRLQLIFDSFLILFLVGFNFDFDFRADWSIKWSEVVIILMSKTYLLTSLPFLSLLPTLSWSFENILDFRWSLYQSKYIHKEINFRKVRFFFSFQKLIRFAMYARYAIIRQARVFMWIRNMYESTQYLREHSYMTSDVFWVFLTYLPTLIRWFTT